MYFAPIHRHAIVATVFCQKCGTRIGSGFVIGSPKKGVPIVTKFRLPDRYKCWNCQSSRPTTAKEWIPEFPLHIVIRVEDSRTVSLFKNLAGVEITPSEIAHFRQCCYEIAILDGHNPGEYWEEVLNELTDTVTASFGTEAPNDVILDEKDQTSTEYYCTPEGDQDWDRAFLELIPPRKRRLITMGCIPRSTPQEW